MAIRDSLNELDPGAPASDRDPLLEQLRDLERRNQESNRSGGGVGVDGSLGTALTGFESEYSNRAAADFADLDVALEPQEFHRTLRAAWSDAMARTPNLVDADRANICPALQRLLRADGAAVGAADGAACVPDVADFPAVYTTVREPLDGRAHIRRRRARKSPRSVRGRAWRAVGSDRLQGKSPCTSKWARPAWKSESRAGECDEHGTGLQRSASRQRKEVGSSEGSVGEGGR